MDTAKRTGLDPAKTASKAVVHKTAETAGELIGDNFAKEMVNPKPPIDENSRNVEKMNIPPEKRQEILNKFRQVL